MSEPIFASPSAARRSPLRRLVRSLSWTLLWLSLYVLSIGPMFWQWHAGRYAGGSKTVVVFYMPLLYACEIEPVGRAVNAYINWWIL